MKTYNNLKIALLRVLFAFMVLLLNSCIGEIKSPVMPTWNSEYVNIPLIHRTESLKDIIKNEKNLFIDSLTFLLRYDSTQTKNISLNEIFKNEIKFSDRYVIKPSQVDYIGFKTLIFDDSVSLKKAQIKYGNIDIRIINYLDRNINTKLKIPGFTKGTDTLTINISANALSAGMQNINLSGYIYNELPTNPLNNIKSGIYIEGEASLGSGYSGDSITIDFRLDSLAFNYLKGKSKPYSTKISEKTNEIKIDNDDIKELLPKIDIKGARVLLNSNSTINNIEVQLKNLQIYGLFSDGKPPKVLKINGKESLDTIISLTQPIILSVNNFGINQFINPNIPDSITIKGDIIFNPNNKDFELSLPDTIFYTVKLELSGILKIDNATKSGSGSIDSLDEDTKKKLDNLLEASLTVELDNGFPVGFSFVGYISDSLKNKLFYISRQKGDGSASDTIFVITGAPVNSQGDVTGIASNQIKQIKLTYSEIQMLKRMRYINYYFILNTTNKQYVNLKGDQKYSIRLLGNFKINVDTEKLK